MVFNHRHFEETTNLSARCALLLPHMEHLSIFLTLLHCLCLKCPFCHLPVPVVPGYNALSVSSTDSRFHGLNCRAIARSVSSTATLKHLLFIIVACVISYSLLSDYKQLKGGICVSVIFDPKEIGTALI